MIAGTPITVLGSGSKDYLTPWFPAAAENAFFTYEIVHSYFDEGGGLTVTAYTKNRGEVGSEGDTSFTSFAEIGSTGLFHKQCENLKGLVRFKLALAAATSSTSRTEGATIRFLAPSWYSTATSTT